MALYDKAETKEDIERINNSFDEFPSLLQERYRGEKEDEKIETLFSNLYNTYGEIQSNESFESQWQETYGSAGKDTFKEIIKNYKDFKDSNTLIMALNWACEGDSANMKAYFRDMWSWDQEKYLPIIMEAFGGKLDLQ